MVPAVGDPDVLIVGDLNAYAGEDPIAALEAAGYTNLVKTYGGPDAYSYVFDAQSGYLDYQLASSSFLSQITGAGDAHHNADEPSVLDYNTDFKSAGQVTSLYAPDRVRTSDHDPVLVGLNPLAVTSTALTVTPASPAVAGTRETLKATISPAATGTVVFKDGTATVGNPVPVAADGTASITATLTPGPHTLTATFTPTDTTAYTPSTSPVHPYQAYATATAITMQASPNPAFQGLLVVLTARVSPFTAAGTVQFRDGTTTLGAPVRVLAGQALLITSALTTGTHSLSAVFTPTNPTAFGPSTSPPVTVTVRKLR